MNYHLIGMGGIGMSALARILLQKGSSVQGSDVVESALLSDLQKEGALLEKGQSGSILKEGDTVVYSSGIREDNEELLRAKELGLQILHRSELLDLLMQNHKSLLVTGTHGKTTTTALLIAVLNQASLDPSFVLGGLLAESRINGRLGKGNYFVAEADESDGSFLKSNAFGAIITNMGIDHLEHWKKPERLFCAFREFFEKVEEPNHLFWCADDPKLTSVAKKGRSYGFSPLADWKIESLIDREDGISFDLVYREKRYPSIQLNLLGRHNACNAAAVFALSHSLGVDEESIRKAFSCFEGISRRMERVGSAQNIEIYDDYAHHPTEIQVTLQAFRSKIRERRLIAIVQPHRYSRVRDLLHQFAGSFEEADLIWMTEIYAAGEEPIFGVGTGALYKRLVERYGDRVCCFARDGLEKEVAKQLRPGDAVLLLGAGDITQIGRKLLKQVQEIQPKYTIGVLSGGTSAESEVSLMSGETVLQSLDRNLYEIKSFYIGKDGTWSKKKHSKPSFEKKEKISGELLQELYQCDVCIPMFHGPEGEDGMIQGFLDTLSIPYVGCDYRSSALCMQKSWAKQIALMHAIPTAPFLECSFDSWKKERETFYESVESLLSFPVWIKPVHLGSSIGISRAETKQELIFALESAFQQDSCCIVEKEIVGREIEFAVFGNEVLQVGSPGEIVTQGVFYDFERKYGEKAIQGTPRAVLSNLEKTIGSDLALRVYRAFSCTGRSRVDFFLDEEGCFWFNEINPIPGCTPNSLYFPMFEMKGMSREQICNEWISLALHRSRRERALRGKK